MRHLHLIRGTADQTLPPGAVPVRPLPKTGLGPIRPRTPPTAPPRPAPPLYDRAREYPDETIFVPLTAIEWSLIVGALAERGQGNSLRPGSQAHADLAAQIRHQVLSRTITPPPPDTGPHPTLWSDPDPCTPTGLPR